MSREIMAERKTKEHYTFDQWLALLDTEALTRGMKTRLVAQTGADCWLCYYNVRGQE